MKNCLLNLFRTVIFFLFAVTQIEAQSRLSVYPQGGVIIGTPIGKIPEGATGKPGVEVLAGMEFKWMAVKKISLNLGALFAHKSSEFQMPVTGKYNISDGILGIKLPFPINVKYRGTVTGAISNKYLDIPLYGGFQVGKSVILSLGYQYSRLLEGQFDGKADIKALALNFPNQEFDESHLLKKNDHAAIAGMHYKLFDRLELRLRLAYALNEIFTEVPEGMPNMHNFYLGAMLAYGFSL